MIPYVIDISDLIYEARFDFNLEVTKNIVTSFENAGFTVKDFLEGLSIICDQRNQSQASMCLERAAESLSQIKEIKETL
jgi:hypothetical protein